MRYVQSLISNAIKFLLDSSILRRTDVNETSYLVVRKFAIKLRLRIPSESVALYAHGQTLSIHLARELGRCGAGYDPGYFLKYPGLHFRVRLHFRVLKNLKELDRGAVLEIENA